MTRRHSLKKTDDMMAYLFPIDGCWMLKVSDIGFYVDSKDEGIELCKSIAGQYGITDLKVADINNGFPDSD